MDRVKGEKSALQMAFKQLCNLIHCNISFIWSPAVSLSLPLLNQKTNLSLKKAIYLNKGYLIYIVIYIVNFRLKYVNGDGKPKPWELIFQFQFDLQQQEIVANLSCTLLFYYITHFLRSKETDLRTTCCSFSGQDFQIHYSKVWFAG